MGCYRCTDLVISGDEEDGIRSSQIDGSGARWWEWKRKLLPFPLNVTRPHLLEIAYSSNVILQNIRFQNSPFWTVHIYTSSDVVMRRVSTRAPALSPNTDGVDPDSVSNFLMEECDIESGDDGISVKSGLGNPLEPSTLGRPSQNVTIVRTRVGPSLGLALGSEMSGGIQNVLIENVVFDGSANAVRMKTGRGRGSYIENVTYRNLTLVGVPGPAFFINEFYAKLTPPVPAALVPVVRNIVVDGMKGVAGGAGLFMCLPEAPCEFSLSHIRLASVAGYDCNHTAITCSSDCFPAICRP